MSKISKFYLSLFLIMASFALFAPCFLFLFEKPFASVSFAYARTGMLFGYDAIGRAILPQVLVGGRDLLLAALISAVISRGLGLAFGLYFQGKSRLKTFIRFLFDCLLVVPVALVSLASYEAFKGSVYAIIPIASILTVPFNSRYYEALAAPIFKSSFYEYRSLYEPSKLKLLFQEVVPILLKNILVDIASSFISSIYMLSSISFISSSGGANSFLWSKMLSENLAGFVLNPCASLVPLILIVLLCAPLNFFVDSIQRQNYD